MESSLLLMSVHLMFIFTVLELMSTVCHLHAVGHMWTHWTLLERFSSCHGCVVQLVDSLHCSVFVLVLNVFVSKLN